MVDRTLAMFPLSTVLFPRASLTLHVFEPRYRRLVADCLAGDRRVGVVLIARGSEVGGGDRRVDVGTVASIETAQSLPDGRWLLAALGEHRIRVTQWLLDDPYPRAVVEDDHPSFCQDDDTLHMAEAELRRVRALLSELGHGPALPRSVSFGDVAEEVVWRLCAEAPVTVFDRQRLLEAPGSDERLMLLLELLRAVGDDLDHILAGG